MSTYFPEWAGTPKEAITLRNVLQMESGRQWNEDYGLSEAGGSDVISMDLAHADFLRPIVESIVEPATATPVVPGPEAQPTTRDPSGQAMVPCPPPPAAPIQAEPNYSG